MASCGMVHISDARRLRSRNDRDALEEAGLRGWACISRVDKKGNRLLLGFDAITHACRITRDGELGLLHMGLDVIANVLDRQALEQERERLEARLQQSRRLETVGALASGITHNFDNMLGAIQGYAEMASELDARDGPQAALLREIRNAGQRARELVDQILSFARRRDASPRPVRVRTLVDESVSLLRALFPALVELSLTGVPDATVLGEPAQLQQVIVNLGNNAAQVMEHEGRIELYAEAIQLPRRRALSHGTPAPGSYVRITASDRGRGIDAATLERIFEPFFTTRWNGNGLGLATTTEIVAEHRGAMLVQSTVGIGTRFEVWLPQLRSPVAAEPHVPEPLRGEGQTILVIEEHPERLLRDEEILAALGFEPVGFSQAAAAEAVCRSQPERFDALVIGHVGSSRRALQLAASLREAAPTLPILLGAASADGLDANYLAYAGVSDVPSLTVRQLGAARSTHRCPAPRRPRTERHVPE
jgi:signal transduction histidine kinase